jgi:hypothetical protein
MNNRANLARKWRDYENDNRLSYLFAPYWRDDGAERKKNKDALDLYRQNPAKLAR